METVGVETLSVWQFAVELLKYFGIIWAFGIMCWAIVFWDWRDKHRAKKYQAHMEQSKKGYVIRPQERSMDGVLAVYQTERLFNTKPQHRTGFLRNLRDSKAFAKLKRGSRFASRSLHRWSWKLPSF